MPLAQFVFSETSPSAAGAALSSQPVMGSVSSGMPSGQAGRFDDYASCFLAADLVGATGGTLDVYLQTTLDGGTSWYDLIHFAQLASGAGAISYAAPVSLSTGTTAPQVVGKGSVGGLAAGKVICGAFGDRCRLLMVAGTGTSAGAPVVVRLTAQRPRLRE